MHFLVNRPPKKAVIAGTFRLANLAVILGVIPGGVGYFSWGIFPGVGLFLWPIPLLTAFVVCAAYTNAHTMNYQGQ